MSCLANIICSIDWDELTLRSGSQRKNCVFLDTADSNKIWLNWNMKYRNSKPMNQDPFTENNL